MTLAKGAQPYERAYNFHGLLRLSVRSFSPGAMSHFDAEYGDYRTDSGGVPDLEVIVDQVGFAPWTEGHFDSQHPMPSGNGVITGHDWHKITHWRYAIQGLNEPCTRFYCSGGPLSIDFLHNRYVEQMIRYKLSPGGHTLVHGCSLSKGGRSVLLPGLSHVGKTSIALALVERGWQFQSDDYTFLGADGQTFSYLSRLNISNHVTDRYPDTLRIALRHRLSMACRRVIYEMSLKYCDLPEPLAIRDLVRNVVIDDVASLGQIILLSPHPGPQLEDPSPVSPAKVTDRICAINQWEGRHFQHLLLAYAAGKTGVSFTQWLDRERHIVESAVQRSACYELSIPRETTNYQALLKQVCDRIEDVAAERFDQLDQQQASSVPTIGR